MRENRPISQWQTMNDFIHQQLKALHDNGVYRRLPINEGPIGPVISLNGQSVINLASNNYLGLANHPVVKAAAIKAVETYGVGAGAVRTIVGNMDVLELLEQELAIFKEEEAVTVFQSGFMANVACIPAVVGAGDLILSDAKNHASIIDAIKLSKAEKQVYPNVDMDKLESILQTVRGQYNQVMIVTDAVFSMDGNIAPLPELVRLAKQYHCLTYVDDAHGAGVLGSRGKGTIDHFHLHGQIDFIMGTLSKAVGVVGGYIASSKEVKEYLLHAARPALFSTALPPADIAAIRASIQLMSQSDELQTRLWEHSTYFKTKLAKLGFDLAPSQTPITPVMIYDEALTMKVSKLLLERGVFVSGIVFPTVVKGQARLRCMISAEHTKDQLDQAVEMFEQVGREVGLIR
jgi:glycine C-acetyltransferase